MWWWILAVTMGGAPPATTERSAADVQTAMRQHMPAFRACFERGLKDNEQLTGRWVYRFTIAPGGKVSKAAPTAPTETSAKVDTCIVAEIKRVVFAPAPTETTITYPFQS